MFASIPNYNAFYLKVFLASKGYKDACTKFLTEPFSVYMRLIRVINISDLIPYDLSNPFLLRSKLRSKAVTYSMINAFI